MKKLLLITILTFSFGLNAQTIQSVNPNAGSAGETLQVTITGDNTSFVQVSDTYNVSFFNNLAQQLVVNSIDIVSNTVLIADIFIPYFMPTGSFNLEMNTWSAQPYFLANAFNVTNTLNTISGNIGFDLNGNGCDVSDAYMAGVKVKLNDGTTDTFTYTDAAGNYTFFVSAGNFVVTPDPEMPYYNVAPVSATVSFATQNNLAQTQNFCLSPNGVYNDLYISLLPVDPARPGFDATYKLVYKNNGNQTMNGTINFSFDGTRLDFVAATPMVTSQTSNTLSWDYTNLLPFETREITLTLNVNSPMETPAVNIGDMLSFFAIANPIAGDETPTDNTADFNQMVVGSYDPNDKAVVEGSQVAISNSGDYLHYLIRFQNSGTFAAENVVVKDMLSSNLDTSTLEVISASHPYRSTLTSGNKLEFFFENINLPPEITDEPGSHGYIAFRIKPVNTVVIGSTIENTAEIFFDFNFPIVTNTVATTFTVLANSSFNVDNGIQLYPNPAGDVLNIKNQSSSEITSVKIFNQLGQLVKTVANFDQSQNIAVNDLKTGTYFVQITSTIGISTKKLIKL